MEAKILKEGSHSISTRKNMKKTFEMKKSKYLIKENKDKKKTLKK